MLSKAAYDLVTLRTGSVRARRARGRVGYVGTEFAKEAPYYAGAFGAALLTETVSANDALDLPRRRQPGRRRLRVRARPLAYAFLREMPGRPGRHRGAPAYAAFEDDWVPREYLADYYSAVEPDERRTIAFFVDAMRDAAPGEPVLFFGVGPTLHHVFLAAGKASEIHLGDYLPANLREIERWIARDAAAHDWRPFVRYTLECEGLACPDGRADREREEITRAKITAMLQVDVRRADPLGERDRQPYGTVISAYCADSATDDRARGRPTWRASPAWCAPAARS